MTTRLTIASTRICSFAASSPSRSDHALATRLADALKGKADSIEKNAAIHDIGRYMLTQKSTPETLQAGLDELGPHAMLADLGPSMSGATNAP